MTIFQCENSPDGIFTGVYDAWDSRLGHENVKLQVKGNENYELFASYIEVTRDGEKAEKVARTLRRRLGMEAYESIYKACLSKEMDKAQAVYQTIVLGLSPKGGAGIMQQLQHPAVFRVFELARKTGSEAHKYLEFIRFQELKNGVLFSEIAPESQVLSLIGDHFADRFPMEHFLIYDRTHQIFLIHEAGKAWGLVEGEQPNRDMTRNFSGEEEEFQRLWQTFHRAIAIEERRNERLQQQFLPKKFRVFMPEKF